MAGFISKLAFPMMLTAVTVACSSGADSAVGTSTDPIQVPLSQSRPGLLGLNAGISAQDIAEVGELQARRVRIEFRVPNDQDPTPITDRAHWDGERAKVIGAYRDALSAYSSIKGMRILLTVDYEAVPQREKHTGSATEFQKYVDEYVHALASIMSELGPYVSVWELWNEPDHNGAGPVDSKLFAMLLTQASKVARQHAAPGAKIISGVASVLYWADLVRDTAAANLPHPADAVDAINLHPYNNWPSETQSATYAADYPASGQSLAHVLRDADAISHGKPFWFSEYGNQTRRIDDGEEANYLTQFFAFMQNPPADVAPLVTRVHEAYFFGLRDFNDKKGLVPMGLFAGSRKKSAWTVFYDEAHASPP
jgi:hypothetical protein